MRGIGWFGEGELQNSMVMVGVVVCGCGGKIGDAWS